MNRITIGTVVEVRVSNFKWLEDENGDDLVPVSVGEIFTIIEDSKTKPRVDFFICHFAISSYGRRVRIMEPSHGFHISRGYLKMIGS